MIVEVLDQSGQTLRIDASRVLVRGAERRVFMFAVDYSPGVVYCAKAGDADFKATADACGIEEIPDVYALVQGPGLKLTPVI